MLGSSAAAPASDMPHSFLAQDASGSVVNGIRPALESKSFGVYIQDDWKVNRKLTLNLGLRWDFETGMTERYDRYAAFDPNVRSPLSDKVGLDLKGGYIFPNKGIDGRGLRSAQLGNIAPRIGIAYQIAPNTVIRTGYGIFYTMAPYGANNYGTAPFRASTPWLTSLDGVTPYNLLRNPYPEGVLVPEGGANGLLAALGQGVGAPVPDTLRTPYNQQWNFTISQQIGSSMAIEIGYAGNKGTLLPLSWQYDQLRVGSDDSQRRSARPGSESILSEQINVGVLSTPTVQRGHLLTPFPQYPGRIVRRRLARQLQLPCSRSQSGKALPGRQHRRCRLYLVEADLRWRRQRLDQRRLPRQLLPRL